MVATGNVNFIACHTIAAIVSGNGCVIKSPKPDPAPGSVMANVPPKRPAHIGSSQVVFCDSLPWATIRFAAARVKSIAAMISVTLSQGHALSVE